MINRDMKRDKGIQQFGNIIAELLNLRGFEVRTQLTWVAQQEISQSKFKSG